MLLRMLAVAALLGASSIASAQAPDATPTPSSDATAAPMATPGPMVGTPGSPPSATASELGTGRRTSIGGYGEVHFNSVNGKTAGNQIDVHRFIVFVGHRFDDKMAFYSELEVEHAGEEVELEQAYIEYVSNRFLGARVGLVLVPMGIINTFHEPPTFHGVERNTVDRVIIPTTWREGGGAIFGEPIEGLRYQVLVVNGLDAAGFSGGGGIRGGRLGGGEAVMNDVAVIGRVDYSPFNGFDAGATYYGGSAGQDQVGLSHVSLNMGEADFRFNRMGIWLRGQYVRGKIGGAADLDATLTDPIGSVIEGYYAEAAYDVLAIVRGKRQRVTAELWPFVRYERTNTQIEMPLGLAPNLANDQSVVTAGISLKPNPRVVVKADYQWTDARAGNPPNVWNLGIGYMF